MKKTFTLFAAILFFAVGAVAQKLSYQAVVRNSANELVYSAHVTVSLKVLAADGTTVQYAETQTATTNQNGMLTLIIGESSSATGSLDAVNWINASIRTDITLPTGEVVTNIMPVTAVPYALYADDAGGSQGPQGEQGLQGEQGPAGLGIQSVTGPVTNGLEDTYTIHYTDGTSSTFVVTNGAAGDTGLPGATGLSAYQIWLNAGNTGSEADFLGSLKGADGAAGQQGPQGIQGPQGEQGIQGLQGETGATGLSAYQIWLNAGNTGSEADFLSSLKGAVGADGKGIASINKTGMVGLVDTYTITYTDNTTSTFTVTNCATNAEENVQADWNVTDNTSDAFIKNKPTIPAAQVQSDWNATSGMGVILNKPTIPTVPTNVSAFTNDANYITLAQVPAQVNADWNATSGMGVILNKPTLATVATSGSYNDLSDKPTIPTVNNATLTIQKNGTNVQTFTANQSSNATANITVNNATLTIQKNGTNVATFTADASTNATANITVPTKTSDLTNDSGFLTSHQDISGKANKSEMSVTAGTGANTDKTTIQLRNGVSATVLTQHQDVSGFITNADLQALIDDYEHKIDSLGDIIEDVGSQYATVPDVFSVDVSEIGSTSATIIGRVFSTGGSALTQYGFLYGTNPDPSTFTSFIDQNNINIDAENIFTGSLSGLSNSTTYYVRAFARNIKGISYGAVLSFTTHEDESISILSCPDAPTVTDADGNVYNTVLIGEQCWMRENLRTTHYATSDNTITMDDGTTANSDAARIMYSIPNLSSNQLVQYGYLYNWAAATDNGLSSANPSGIPGICPTNWHIPSDDEWTQLENYVKNQALYLCNNTADNIAKALASPNTWTNHTTNCNVGCAPSDNNETGFTAVAAGAHTAKGTTIADKDQIAYFWSTTTNASSTAIAHKISYNSATVTSTNYSRSNAYSVRCIKNVDVISPEILMKMPQVVTQAVSSVGANTATIDVIVSLNTGGTAITSRGICWSSTQTKPTIASNKSTNGGAEENFTITISDLEPGMVYYVRAFATNSYGTSYGETLNFTTFENSTAAAQVCPGTNTVKDYDGNVYNTVKIGDQCWTRENMRTTHFESGEEITFKSTATGTYTESWMYAPNNQQYNVPRYGYLYNWYATTNGNTSGSTDGNPLQGICPEEWHIPSEAEWNTLINTVQGQTDCQCNNEVNKIAKALSSPIGWTSYGTACTPGNINNNTAYNNKSGFSALPAGTMDYRDGYNYRYFSTWAYYWSSTPSTNTSYARSVFIITYSDAAMRSSNAGDWYRVDAFSVRCLKD